MLVLQRKEGQKVIVTLPGGQRIVVALVKIRGSRVSLGFEADDAVKILREEVEVEDEVRSCSTLAVLQ